VGSRSIRSQTLQCPVSTFSLTNKLLLSASRLRLPRRRLPPHPPQYPSGHCPFYRLFRSPATLAPAQLPRPLILEARNTTSPCPSVFTSHTRAQKCLRQSVGLCSSSMTSDPPARPSVMELQLQSHFYLERALTCSIYQCRSFQWKKRSKSHVKRLQRRLRMSTILRIMERVLHPLRSLILDGLFLQRDHFH
jgi:hypothetical protein